MHKNILTVVGITILFLGVVVIPMTLGYDDRVSDKEMLVESDNYDMYLYPEYYDCYSVDEIDGYVEYQDTDVSSDYEPVESTKPLDAGPPMDSPWPMFKNNERNTGCSTYNTLDNPGYEKWFFKTESFVQGSAAIDNDGVIYFGSWDNNLYALYPNGTLKWMVDIEGNVETSPAINDDGVIYVGITSPSADYRLYAINPDGTFKWKYPGTNIWSSPVIAIDGTIVFADADNWKIKALYPNGTLKWSYKTNHVIYSSPAIDDNTVYIGCHDNYLYALWLNNGTLKWKFGTGNWVRVSPCVGDDGTIYIVSLSDYLYAVNPNGTLKWKVNVGAGTHPSIGPDGTIYAGYKTLYAINPRNGSVKWTYNVPGNIRAGTPCISSDGSIYFGTSDNGLFVALNPDGTEKWQKYIGVCEFGPVIDRDGTIYVGSSHDEWVGGGYVSAGYLHAFNDLEPDAPSAPSISGPKEGKYKTAYEFKFSANSPLGNDLFYFVDWGDWSNTGWIGPYQSGELIVLKHAFKDWPPGKKVFNIRVKPRDEDERWGPWGYHMFNIPRTRATTYLWYQWFIERFPLLERLLTVFRVI